MESSNSAATPGSADPLDLSGQRVLLTGGAGDIGVAIARLLVAHGATVVINDLYEEPEARRRLDPIPVDATPYVAADITQEDQVRDLFSRARQISSDPFDVVCCHAGLVGSSPIQEFPLDMFDAINSVNVRGSFLVGREAARQWRLTDSPGQLIFTSSWVQGVSWPETAPYSASKAAVQSLARSFARELAPFGIRSNVVAPGIVRVGMAKRQWDSDPAYRARAERAVPMGYLQTPESVADAFLFMCSSLSRYMTGATLVVDGGCSLYPMS